MPVNYSKSYYMFKYPSEHVAALLSRLAKNNDFSGKKALDFGFGSGRHVKLLKDFGFDVYGIDIDQDAKDTMYDLHGNIITDKNIAIGNIFEEDIFENESFDVILAFGIVYIFDYETIRLLLRKLFNKLNKGGFLIASYRTKFDYVYNRAKSLEDECSAVDECGRRLTFVDMDDLKMLYSHAGAEIVSVERYDNYPNGEIVSYWIVNGVGK